MANLQDHSERIAEIEDILRAGISSVSTDGTTVNYDLASLRQELRALKSADATHRGRRPRIRSIDLSNTF